MFKKKPPPNAEDLIREAVTDPLVGRVCGWISLGLPGLLIATFMFGGRVPVPLVITVLAISFVLCIIKLVTIVDADHVVRPRYATAIMDSLAPEIRADLARVVAGDRYANGQLLVVHLYQLLGKWHSRRLEQHQWESQQRTAALAAQIGKGTDYMSEGT